MLSNWKKSNGSVKQTSPFDTKHNGWTLLHHAVNFRRWQTASLLLSQRASLTIENNYGRTPLSEIWIAYHAPLANPQQRARAYAFIEDRQDTETALD
jgi:ankyrin repeat protein